MNHGLSEWAGEIRDAQEVFLPILAHHADLLVQASLDSERRRQIVNVSATIEATLQRLPDVIEALREDKAATARTLEALGLPHFQAATGSTADFLQNPVSFFNQLATPAYYVSVNSADPKEQRQRQAGLDQTAAREFVQAVVDKHGDTYDTVVLMETAEILYGGNIAVSGDEQNSITAELVQGTHSDLVGGLQPIVMTLNRDPERGLFRFERLHPYRYDDPLQKVELHHEEEAIRRVLYAALKCIRHTTDEEHGQGFELRGAEFEKGYYEVAIIQLRQNGPLVPMFIEVSKQPPFMPKAAKIVT
jgi:hypothetical protein